MIADGLTKTLSKDKHQKFVEQMGLVDISQELQQRSDEEKEREEEIDSNTILQQFEDTLEGGEVEV